MGSCFSKRKKSDAAVTHNASPRSSFSLSCKSDAVMAPSPLRAHKRSDEIVVVVSKDSAPLLANTQRTHSLKKSQSAKALCAHKLESGMTHVEEKGHIPLSVPSATTCTAEKGHIPQSVPQDIRKGGCDDNLIVQKTEKDQFSSHNEATFLDKKLCIEPIHQESTNISLQIGDGYAVSENVNEQPVCTAHGEDVTTTPPAGFVATTTYGSNVEDKEMVLVVDDEFVIEAVDLENVLPLATLKRSRSCEETIRSPDMKRPPGRRSFQESSAYSPRTARLETIPEPPHFGTTKFLEGLDLVDVLPHRLSNGENQSGALLGMEEELKPALLDFSQHESHGLTADFFTLKSRYLSSCALSSQNALPFMSCPDADDGKVSVYSVESDAEDDMISSFGLMHSRASSLDSGEQMDMVNLYSSSCRHPIPVVEEEDENESGSDDLETFEFKHAISLHADGTHQKRSQLINRVIEEGEEIEKLRSCGLGESKEVCPTRERKGSARVKELSVVATGDALLYTGSNSEEFDLIPSKSYARGSPETVHSAKLDVVHANQNAYYTCHKAIATDEDQEKQQQNSLSVDDIILLLEKDELDEDVLLSFLNLAKSTSATSHCGSTLSCHVSDVASEASFEFKVRSSGSTPHSTPSTPMLSAGSTPKRITQLSPLALTSEEIAEIWGVFEQRQALSPFQMCNFP
ncbi:hypothetical protein L7F22_054697 [Adiantum nelumboides]|nr:hypothetical protein [Adiantum nelumboides]